MGLRIAASNQSRCRQRGGSLAAGMNLFDRFARVVKVRYQELFTCIYVIFIVVCLSWWLLTAICCITHITWYSFLCFAVLCKCSNKFIWRSRENFRANSAWNEWRFDKDASGYSTSKASVTCSFLKFPFCQFILRIFPNFFHLFSLKFLFHSFTLFCSSIL